MPAGTSALVQLNAEVLEEAGLRIGDATWTHLVTHATPKMVLASYYLNLGTIERYQARRYLDRASGARDTLAEGCVTWMPMTVWPGGKGLPARLASGNMATAVREELVALYRMLQVAAPTGACAMPDLP